MKFSRNVWAVDSHTVGEATRVITGGVPHIPGATMPEKKEWLEKNLDQVRTGLMLEPRGHNDMFGSIITAPVSADSDFGVIFMDSGGYLNMCGHGSIGTCTVAVETGMVPVEEPITKINFDAPAGQIKAEIAVEDGKAKSVTFQNVPAFLYKRDITADIPGVGKVTFDISFGGSFFVIIKASEVGIDICPENAQKLLHTGFIIRDWVNENIEIQHPELPHIKTVDLVEWWGPAKQDDCTLQNCVVFGDASVDRSPCGTGTSAKMATLVAKGELEIGEEFVYESIIGTKFYGKALKKVKVGEFDGIIPQVTGSAYITGFNHFVFDDTDPLEYGFMLG